MSCIVLTGSEVEKQLLSYYEHVNVHYKQTYGTLEVIYRYELTYLGHGIYGYEWRIVDYVLSYEESKYIIDRYKNIMIDDQVYLIVPIMTELSNQYIHEQFCPKQTEGVYIRHFGVTIYTIIPEETSSRPTKKLVKSPKNIFV